MENYKQNTFAVYLKLFLNRKLFISIIVILFTLTSVAVALILPQIYKSEVLVAPVSQNDDAAASAGIMSQISDLASVGGLNIGGGGDVTSITTSIAYLKSRVFNYLIIEELNLIPDLFPEKWDASANKWIDENDVPSMWDAYKDFEELMAVDEDPMTGLVKLSIEWPDPEKASIIVSTMIERANEIIRSEAISDSDENLNFLYSQLEETQINDIRNTLNQLIMMEMQKSMLANSSSEYAFEVIDPAYIPEDRIKPKRALIVVLGVMLGLFFSLTFLVLQEAWSNFRKFSQSD